jgi:hypothetical protein
MAEYGRHIEEYSNYWFSSFSKWVPENQWGNKTLAEAYLRRYWLPEQEYKTIWKPIQERIFSKQESLTDLSFAQGFHTLSVIGGCLFHKDDFELLQSAIRSTGDEHFVIIQNTPDFTEGEPMFKMKFPVNTSWEELTDGNYISAVLFEMNYNEYFVFGASGKWGKYAATERAYPLDLIGFKPEYSTIFNEQFRQSKRLN